MLSREAFIKDRDYVFNKVYGALAGIAIGDSFGDAARMQENRANYQITTDFNKGASWSTDDTEFALLTAHTIIRCGGKLTTEECVKSWMEHVEPAKWRRQTICEEEFFLQSLENSILTIRAMDLQ